MCLDNRGNEISLDIGKVYRVVRPKKLDPHSMLRIVDNEGEDYLYNAKQFVLVDLPARGRRAIAAAGA